MSKSGRKKAPWRPSATTSMHSRIWWAFFQSEPKWERQRRIYERKKQLIKRIMGDGQHSIRPLAEFYDNLKDREQAFFRYYDYARKEIDREDEITFKRLGITLSFQAFLIGAKAFIFTALVSNAGRLPPAFRADARIDSPDEVMFLITVVVLALVSWTGYAVSRYSFLSVQSSRASLHWAKDSWVTFNKINGRLYPSLVPQLTKYAGLSHKLRHRADQGTDFALEIPRRLKMFWLLAGILWPIFFLLAFLVLTGDAIFHLSFLASK